jgi:hypothetical protein
MSDFLNGIFIEKKTGKWGDYQHASVKVEDFIKALRELPMNDKGYAAFAISPQKDNPNKYSCKKYKGERQQQAPPIKEGPEGKDDLPF